MSSPPASKMFGPDVESAMVRSALLWGRVANRFGRESALVRVALGVAIVMLLMGMANNVVEPLALRLISVLIGGYASASIAMVGTQAPFGRTGSALGFLSTGTLTSNFQCESRAGNRAAMGSGLSARSNSSLVVALLLAAMLVLLANEPVISMYVERLGAWCRERL
jgi:hypothetical protein